jgi:hypothetical protein
MIVPSVSALRPERPILVTKIEILAMAELVAMGKPAVCGMLALEGCPWM